MSIDGAAEDLLADLEHAGALVTEIVSGIRRRSERFGGHKARQPARLDSGP